MRATSRSPAYALTWARVIQPRAPPQVLHVSAVLAKDKKKSGFFEAPCYRVKKRTGLNYITNLMLRSDEPASKWTLRGVALLCSTD